MKMHSRLVRDDFFTRPRFRRWPSNKKLLYIALTQMADDCGSLEYDAEEITHNAFRADPEVSQGHVDAWISEMIETRDLVLYEGDYSGGEFLYIRDFVKDQKLAHPGRCSVDIPEWVQVVESKDRRGHSRLKYIHSDPWTGEIVGASDHGANEDAGNPLIG